jgi:phosphoribosylpyrophosphate synthetase
VVLLESFCTSLTCVLPFYPTATMERVDVTDEGAVATASTLAWLFNSLPRAAVATKVVVYDIHTLQNRFYLKGGSVARLDTALPLLGPALARTLGDFGDLGDIVGVASPTGGKAMAAVAASPRIVFAFPDEGASKRFTALLPPGAAVAVCGKVRREGGGRIVSLHDGGAHLAAADVVVVVDDLVQSGGTLLECGRVLRAACGARPVRLFAFVTHAVFPRRSWEKFVPGTAAATAQGELVFDKFWITDSRPRTVDEIMAADRADEVFEVLSLAPLIAKHILP